MLAAIHNNPMIKQKTMVEMYRLIKNEKDFVVDELGDEGEGFDEKTIPRVYKNTMSLRVSTEMSVKLLEETCSDDSQLLYFLGCLPGGANLTQLKQMWTKPTIQKGLDRLEQLSFLEVCEEKKYVLTPFMLSFTGESIDQINKQTFMKTICEYYSDLLLKIFNKIGQQTKSGHTDGKNSPSNYSC